MNKWKNKKNGLKNKAEKKKRRLKNNAERKKKRTSTCANKKKISIAKKKDGKIDELETSLLIRRKTLFRE